MTNLMKPQEAMLALTAAVRQNLSSHTEEIEITLYDASKNDGKDAMLIIRAKNFDVQRRDAQEFEIDKARVAVEGKYKTSWLFSLD